MAFRSKARRGTMATPRRSSRPNRRAAHFSEALAYERGAGVALWRDRGDQLRLARAALRLVGRDGASRADLLHLPVPAERPPSTPSWTCAAHAGRGRAIVRENAPNSKQKPRRQHAAAQKRPRRGRNSKTTNKRAGDCSPARCVRCASSGSRFWCRTWPSSRAIPRTRAASSRSHGSWLAEVVVPVRPMQGVPVIREVLRPRHVRNVVALALDAAGHGVVPVAIQDVEGAGRRIEAGLAGADQGAVNLGVADPRRQVLGAQVDLDPPFRRDRRGGQAL